MEIFVKIICSILLLYSCKSTNYIKYHNICNEAEYSFYNGDYKNASLNYGRAFKKIKIPLEQDMIFYSMSLWQIEEREKSLELLDTLLDAKWVLTGSGYYTNIDENLKQEFIRKNKIVTDSINFRRDTNPLVAVFNSLEERDQKARNIWQEFCATNGDEIKRNEAFKLVKSADSLNLRILESIIEEHGFVGGVYFPANPRIMLLFLLHHLDWVNENPRLFKKAIRQGRLLPSDYALSCDKYQISNNKAAIYGQFQPEKISNLRPTVVFSNCNKIGVSPYFNEWVNFPRKIGVKPKKHPYYENYTAQKSRFNCY